MRIRCLQGLAAVLMATSAALVAQGVSATTTPDAVSNGGVVTLIIKAANGTVHLPDSLGFVAVRQGSPTGPNVNTIFSMPVIVTIPACTTYTTLWQVPLQTTAVPVTYFFEVLAWNASYTSYTIDFFPVTVNPPQAALVEVWPTTRGLLWNMALGAPTFAGAPYVAAISATTNVGMAGPAGQFIALDADPLFAISFPNPLPGVFSGFQGSLDVFGTAPPIVTAIPNIPSLACLPLHMQAGVLNPTTGNVVLTNCHDTWIL